MVWTSQKQKILRRNGKNTQKKYTQKILMIHGGVITYLEPDILECEVKGALGTIIMNKASGVKAFDCVITTNCETFLKRWEHQTTLPASW